MIASETCQSPGAMPCSRVLTRTKQLSLAAIARVKWLCACERYWPNRGVGGVYFSAEVGNVYTTYKVSKSKELCPGKMIRK